ncbi:MAG: 2,3-bisphosphoglycerate-independent phosphoglycerate mutase [Verrucomicrobia bacterium]|nr:2,3-bisphosphoglycerate-independent phosphoglycerate mutase [Verrucomicrobiota bacterium]
MAQPVILIIRDGWGINPHGKERAEADGNATLLARTPFHDHLYGTYPGSRLSASGMDVGLPQGQMGNSEVGHLNLGGGRIVYQDLTRINKAIADGELARNEVINQAFAKARGRRLHLIGLVSDGGVHSHQDHLIALARHAAATGVTDICIHAITDGRDTSPTGGAGYLATVERELKDIGAKIITVVGRYFAMDRDKRWDRTKLAWDAIMLGRGQVSSEDPSEAVRKRYAENETDEFLKPIIFSHANEQRIRDADVVFCFNFRADRMRQLSNAFLFEDFNGFEREIWPRVEYVTLSTYDKTFKCPVAFRPQSLKDILGEVVSNAGKRQLRIAETEKYPHVTYFFNGGVEQPFPGEDRVIVPSPKVATYDLQPEMSEPKVTEELLKRLKDYDLVILNFANPDMVGHTGVVAAGVKAVEAVDDGVRQVIEEVLRLDGRALVTADHGNCELMRNPDGSPNTAHTTNLVHLLYVAADAGRFQIEDGILADVAPTLLQMLGLPKPEEMTGHSLLREKA